MPTVRPLPFYSFEVWAPDDNRLATPADLGGVTPNVLLRIPPANLRISTPIRAQVDLDLLGGVTVAQGGLGLGRWTLSGSHGVGLSPQLVSTAQDGSFTLAAGFAVREALQTLFRAWVSANDKRRVEQQPLLRLVFAVRDGTLTEWQNEEWFIQPDTLPEDTRSAGRPLEWAWSLGFTALARVSEATPQGFTDPLLPPSARDLQDDLDAVDTRLGTAQASALLQRKKSLLQKLADLRSNLQGIRTAVSAAVSAYKSTISDVAGYIRSCSNLVEETLLLIDPTNLLDQPARELWDALIDARRVVGNAKRLADGAREPFSPSLVKPSTVSVQPGDTIQSLAARALGDASAWPTLVQLNGLVWPYLDFSGPGGIPDASFTAGGRKVLGAGGTLKLPNAQGAVAPQDPIGTDMDDAGTLHVLVRGADNLRAALLRRLRTPKGYLPHHPEYGSALVAYLGQPLTPGLVMAIRAEVVRTLQADPRVISVQSPQVQVDTDAIRVDTTCTTVLGPVPVNALVQPVDLLVPTPAAPLAPVGLSITGPTSAQAGQSGLQASVVPVDNAVYVWSVANGDLIAGQGTPTATFRVGQAGMVTTVACTIVPPTGAWMEGAIQVQALPFDGVVSGTTGVVASGAGADLDVTLGATFEVLSLTTNAPARVRIYDTAAHRAADASRAIGATPAGAGLIAEAVTAAGQLTVTFNPDADGANGDTPQANTAYLRVDNEDATAEAITVAITRTLKSMV